jgi:hypothetical protein
MRPLYLLVFLASISLVDQAGNLRAEEPHTCAAPPPVRGLYLAGGRTDKFWDRKTVTVRFMDGDPTVKAKVQALPNVWTDACGVRFIFTNSEEADIRVSFNGKGSWSSIGTDALSVPLNSPTMNFGWLTPTTDDDEYRRIVLHEFGHALGFIHEHQHPGSSIRWKHPEAENYYMEVNGWSKEEVQRNVFDLVPSKNYSRFDPLSIMLYAIPATVTEDGYSVGWNRTLSDTDREFSAKVYKNVVRVRYFALDANGGRGGPYMNYDMDGNSNLLFNLDRIGEYVRIRPVVRNVTLDSDGGSGGMYFSADITPNDSRLYKLVKVDDRPSYMIVTKTKNLALDFGGLNRDTGRSGGLFFNKSPNPNNANHVWRLVADGDKVRIISDVTFRE